MGATEVGAEKVRIGIGPSISRNAGLNREAFPPAMPVARRQIDTILTGLAGEYHAAAELCRRGFCASLTLKNTPRSTSSCPLEEVSCPDHRRSDALR